MQGLTGLYGNPSGQSSPPTDYMDEGVLEARAAPGTATSHSEYGNQTFGYGGTVPTDPQTNPSQAAYDAGTDQDSMWGYDFFNFEGPVNRTPTTHDVAWPRGIPQTGVASLSTPGGLEEWGETIPVLHGHDLGGVSGMVRVAPAGHEEATHYTTEDFTAPNENILAKAPGQLRGANASSSGLAGGGGSGHGNAGGSAADPDQGYGVVNSLPEFNAGHSIRRIQHDRMPWDFTLTHGEQEVPFYGRHQIVGQANFDGPDSPYFGQGNISGGQIPWEGRIGDPTEYVQPPEPTILPAANQQSDAYDIYAWG